MGVHINADAELKHINVRKEGGQEMPVTALDLKFTCGVDGRVVMPLLGTEEMPDFWLDDEDKNPRFFGMETVKSWATFMDHSIAFAGLKLPPAKVYKFSFVVRPFLQVELSFTATVHSPSDNTIAILTEMLQQESRLVVDAPPDLFEEEKAA